MRLTTILLIVLLLIVVKLANGQVTIRAYNPPGSTGLYVERIPNIDTTEVEILWTREEVRGDFPKVMNALEVIKQDGYKLEWFYLDENKKPLSKNINVWMSKPIKP